MENSNLMFNGCSKVLSINTEKWVYVSQTEILKDSVCLHTLVNPLSHHDVVRLRQEMMAAGDSAERKWAKACYRTTGMQGKWNEAIVGHTCVGPQDVCCETHQYKLF